MAKRAVEPTANVQVNKELRHFGLLAGALIAAMFGGLIPWLRGHRCPAWPWAVGAVLIGCGAIYPQLLKYPFAIWTSAGKFLGWLNTRLILGVLF
ncbi:MAG TPA: SxtJ family membrane protein, partial [Terriglobales bacterium]|nr:SxtJ family membrane protein [Terriglobales bacterium]